MRPSPVETNQRMIDALRRAGYLRSDAVERAFRAVPRECFLPDVPRGDVYSGRAIVTHRAPDGAPLSSSSEPAVMARMLEQLGVRRDHRVLEVGAGTGYNAALLGLLVGRGGAVTTTDIDPETAAEAEQHLRVVGASNVTVVCADGWEGSPQQAPFDRIEVTAGVSDLSPSWVDQLAPSGVLVAPLWLRAGLQASVAFARTAGHLRSVDIASCGFMRLRGLGAGPETPSTIRGWTAFLDRPEPATVELLSELLDRRPRSIPAPVADPAWFTAAALSDPDAVSLVSYRQGRPITYAGVLDQPSRSLAVIESNGPAGFGAPSALRAFGEGRAQARLEDLIVRTSDLHLTRLVIEAVPAGDRRGRRGSVTVLDRPHFDFVVDAQ